MKSSPRHRRHGFSLPELLTVVALVAIVMSVLLPALGKSKVTVRTALCATNLHTNFQAYANRQIDVRAKSKTTMSAGGWQGALLPYVDGNNVVFGCTEQFNGNGAANAATNVYLKVYSPYPTGYLYDMAMVPGPLCRQVDKTWTDARIDEVWVGHPNAIAARPTIKQKRDLLPATPYSYLLCFEDLRPNGGDIDYEDVIFQITEYPDGVDITYLYDGAGYVFDLVNQDGTIVWKELDAGGTTRLGAKVRVEGGPSTYGMNNAVTEKSAGRSGKNVIFMMDYQRSVAKGGFAGGGWDPWNDWFTPSNIPAFARHYDKANVCFFSGNVQLMDPATIDPRLSNQIRTDYWIP